MLKLKKSLGQNFLKDNNILNKIVTLEPLFDQKIFEIGPGSGNLTNFIITVLNKSSCFLLPLIRFMLIVDYYRAKDKHNPANYHQS